MGVSAADENRLSGVGSGNPALCSMPRGRASQEGVTIFRGRVHLPGSSSWRDWRWLAWGEMEMLGIV